MKAKKVKKMEEIKKQIANTQNEIKKYSDKN